jgi:hypothetical protein
MEKKIKISEKIDKTSVDLTNIKLDVSSREIGLKERDSSGDS